MFRIPFTAKCLQLKVFSIAIVATHDTLGALQDFELSLFKFTLGFGSPSCTWGAVFLLWCSVYDIFGWIGRYVRPLRILLDYLCKM